MYRKILTAFLPPSPPPPPPTRPTAPSAGPRRLARRPSKPRPSDRVSRPLELAPAGPRLVAPPATPHVAVALAVVTEQDVPAAPTRGPAPAARRGPERAAPGVAKVAGRARPRAQVELGLRTALPRLRPRPARPLVVVPPVPLVLRVGVVVLEVPRPPPGLGSGHAPAAVGQALASAGRPAVGAAPPRPQLRAPVPSRRPSIPQLSRARRGPRVCGRAEGWACECECE